MNEGNKKLSEDEYYSKKDRIGTYLSDARNTSVLQFIEGIHVDLGCGDGQLLRAYNGKSIGVDIKDYGAADIVVPNFNSLPLESSSCDTVTIIASLNYFEEVDLVLNECYRILSTNGKLLITMPNAAIMKIWHLFRERWAHKSGYSKKQLINLMNKNQFKLSSSHKFLFGINNIYIFNKD